MPRQPDCQPLRHRIRATLLLLQLLLLLQGCCGCCSCNSGQGAAQLFSGNRHEKNDKNA